MRTKEIDLSRTPLIEYYNLARTFDDYFCANSHARLGILQRYSSQGFISMTILILGAAGMIGRKLTERLIQEGTILKEDEKLVLHDIVKPEAPSNHQNHLCLSGDLAIAETAMQLAAYQPDIVFHLASMVSGEAEQNFDKGWSVNMQGSWHLCEALKYHHQASDGRYRAKIIFASSIAVFGPPFPDNEFEAIHDDFLTAPQTSYGAQKAMVEMLIADYARKGYVDGLSIRLPTICVRPGKPNAAASSFFSGIIREPLNGFDAILPVPDTIRHWHASPRSATGFMVHAANLDTSLLGGRRSLNMPGLSCTVAEQIEALRDIAGEAVIAKIKPSPDDKIIEIVNNWPRAFKPERAISLGFRAETNFRQIIEIYLEDDMPHLR